VSGQTKPACLLTSPVIPLPHAAAIYLQGKWEQKMVIEQKNMFKSEIDPAGLRVAF